MSDATDQARDLLADPPIGVEVWGPIVEGLLDEMSEVQAEVQDRDDALVDVRNGLKAARADFAKARNDRQEFALAIGFASDHRPEGHGVWVPELVDMVDPINEALSSARDHDECPVVCENCGERLADVVCEHCHGSGCGRGTVSGAYEECEWCAGAGKVHPGCVGDTYSDLAGDLAKARNVIERARVYAVNSPRISRAGEADLLAILDEAERGEGS